MNMQFADPVFAALLGLLALAALHGTATAEDNEHEGASALAFSSYASRN